jgi:hypothetical protein
METVTRRDPNEEFYRTIRKLKSNIPKLKALSQCYRTIKKIALSRYRMHNKTVYSIYNYVDLSSKLSKKQVSIEKKITNHVPSWYGYNLRIDCYTPLACITMKMIYNEKFYIRKK